MLAKAKDELTVAELHQDQFTAYAKSNTWYARYANEDELKQDGIYIERKVRDALVKKLDAESRVRSIQQKLEQRRQMQLAAEAAKKLPAEDEKKRQEEVKKDLQRKPEGLKYTPG
jgi:hypothetical protein